MPFPHFHAARVKDSNLFDHIVVLKTLPNGIMIYGGPLKSNPKGGTTAQTYRFPASKFTTDEAKKWLKDNNVKNTGFEAATGGTKEAESDIGIVTPLIANNKELPESIRLFRYGENPTHNDKPLIFTERSKNMIQADFKQRGKDMLIDYDHSSIQENMPADGVPAAGWIDGFKDDGKMFSADVHEWTPKAAKMIADGEYKYFSPVVIIDTETREIIGLKNVALTNEPHMNNLQELAASDHFKQYRLSAFQIHKSQGEKRMHPKLKELCGKMGLADDTTEEQLAEAIHGLIKKHAEAESSAKKLSDITEKLKKHFGDDYEDKLDNPGKKGNGPETEGEAEDPAEPDKTNDVKAMSEVMATMKDLGSKLNSAQKEIAAMKAEKLVSLALSEGKTSEAELKANNGFIQKLAETDANTFNVMILGREKYSVVPLSTLHIHTPAAKEGMEISEAALAIAKANGITEDQLKKYGQQMSLAVNA